MKHNLSLLLLLIWSMSLNAQPTTVGTTDGVFNVSDLGAASYTIPIKVSDGIAGMQPVLSLTYSSQAGNGLCGTGWNLSGSMSAISRVPNTIYNDKKVSGVSLTAEDRFALDGQRLIITGGTNYGAPNTFYRTEIESFRDVKAIGTLGTGPLSFEVTDLQTGFKYQYGTKAASRPTIPGKAEPYIWLLDKVTDLNGNFMEYTYLYNAGEEPRLDKISYTGNVNTGASTKTAILFGYDSRPDPNFSFIAGGKISQNYRLGTIYIVQHDAVGAPFAVRSYHLAYATDVYSHLIKVIVRGHELNGPAEELPATEFTYGATATAYTETQVGDPQNEGVDFAVGDYNADGKSDLIRYTRNYNANYNNWDLFLNVGNQFTLAQTGPLPPIPSQYLDKKYEGLVFGRYYYPAFTDYNGDGKEDFIFQSTYIDPNSANINHPYKRMHVLLSNGSGLTALPNKIIRYDYGIYPHDYFNNNSPFVGDFDGDGKTEILMLNTYKSSEPNYDPNNNYLVGETYLTPTTYNGESALLASPLQGMPFDASYVADEASKLYVIDYDGDKKNEILSVWKAGTTTHAQVFKLNVTYDANNKPVVGNPAFLMVNDGSYPSIDHESFPGDFNGDGITDMLTWISSAGWQIAYGDGNGKMNMNVLNAPFSLLPPKAGNLYRPVLLADFNGDGKTDIFDYGSGAYGSGTSAPKMLYSKGNNSFDTEVPTIATSRLGPVTYTYWPGDFNGDGSTDFMTANSIVQPLYVFNFHPNEFRHSVAKIKNGIGATTNVTYNYLTNTGIYQSGAAAFTYPYIKRTVPFRVVGSVNMDNGTSPTGNNINYTYEGLKFNAHGKGLLGFSKVTTLDVTKNIAQEKVFALNTDYALSYLESSVVKQGQQLLSTASNLQQVYHYGMKRVLPYTVLTTSTDYLKNTTATETYNYTWTSGDPNVVTSSVIGKPTSIVTNKGSGLETITREFTYPGFVTYSGSIGVNNNFWVYSKPSKITVTSIRQGQSAYSRAQNFTYSNATGLLMTTINDPGTSHEQTITNIYNQYGNPTQKTTSASGMSPRTEVYEYDITNRYVTKSYNADYPAVQTNTNYNILTGTVTNITQSDGLIQNFTYDGFGRVKTVTDNSGKSITTNYLSASGDPLAPTTGFAYYAIKTTSNIDGVSYSFYDRLGRLARTAKQGINSQWIFVDDRYNNKGELLRRSIPYFEGGVGYNNTWSYDPAGRVITQNTPQGDNIIFTYASTSNGSTVTATNAAGQVKKTVTDKSGAVTRTEDDGGALDYVYYSNGKVKSAALNNVIVQQYEYDPFGRQTKRTDPNYGSYEYTYNNLDEVLSEKDPKGSIYNYTYNTLGKMTTKSGPEGMYTYIYNTTGGSNCGKLVQLTGPNGVTHNYSYGIGDKVNYEERIIGSETFKTQYSYDSEGRVKTKIYPNNTTIEYSYNPYDGSLQNIGRPGEMYLGFWPIYLYSITEKNAFEQITRTGHRSVYNNTPSGLIGTYLYDSKINYSNYGILQGQVTNKPLLDGTPGPIVRNYAYSFQATTGNLLQRKDQKYYMQEDFTYDNVNRLTNIQGQNYGPSPYTLPGQTMNYSANGNISQKSDAGTFTYNQANKVSEIYPFVNIPTATQNISYTPFDKVATIEEGINKAQFSYWADEDRAKMELLESNTLKKTKFYAGSYEKEIDAISGQIRELCYIYGADDDLIGIIEKKSGVEKIYYVLTDHLGSVTHILDQNGTIVEEKSFDAWGRSRNPQNWTAFTPTMVSNGWDRGYTGHEHLPQFGIINMNGRLYDPLMGRMMEPDPIIVGSNNSQGYNRYSYALNNPLKYTDPDGHNPLLVAAAIGAGVSALMYTGRIAYSDGGFKNWSWSDFTFQTAMGGLSGAVTWGIGTGISSIAFNTGSNFLNTVAQESLRAGLHGATGFMTSGELSQGIASAAGSIAGSVASRIPVLRTDVGSTLFSMAAGGTSASLTGGNFLEGAISAGLVSVLNHAMHQAKLNDGDGDEERNPAQDKKLTPGEIKRLKDHGWDHSDKGKHGGQTDLYRDPKTGEIYQKPKGGRGYGEPIGINWNDVTQSTFKPIYTDFNSPPARLGRKVAIGIFEFFEGVGRGIRKLNQTVPSPSCNCN